MYEQGEDQLETRKGFLKSRWSITGSMQRRLALADKDRQRGAVAMPVIITGRRGGQPLPLMHGVQRKRIREKQTMRHIYGNDRLRHTGQCQILIAIKRSCGYLCAREITGACGHLCTGALKDRDVFERDKAASANPYDDHGGNHGLMQLDTAQSGKRSPLSRDSYANCFLPFLIPYYKSITVVDPRYYYDDLDKLIEEQGIQEILFLYNANTFFSDDSLNEILKKEVK